GVRELPSTGVSYFDAKAGTFVKSEKQVIPSATNVQDEFLVVTDHGSNNPRHELYEMMLADDKKVTSVAPVIPSDEIENRVTRLKKMAALINWKK
ncbi:MAG: hypothetical protein ACXW1W_10445, partial [Methylococcaceae bacterium]